MDRRDFIKLAAYTGLGTILLPGCGLQARQPQQTAPPNPKSKTPGRSVFAEDLVIVQGNDPSSMLDQGFKALGGIENLVKPGSMVVLKPNFSVPMSPEQACTTNPALVAGLVKMCLQAGAQEVKVIDLPLNNAAICLEKTGMKKAVTAAGGKIYILNDPKRHFRLIKVNGRVLKEAKFAKDVLEADVFINMPILKHHYVTGVTIGLKNMMGLDWDRASYHLEDLDRSIAELATFKIPNLIIMDALRGITNNGPRGPGPIREYNQLVFGGDPVAVDAYGTTLFGMQPAQVRHLRLAAELGVGQLDWERLNVKRI